MLMYYVFTQDSVFTSKAQNQLDKPVFYSYLVLLIYVNETIYLLGNLLFFKIHVNHFMAQMTHLLPMLSQCMLWVRGPVPFSETLSFFN